MAPITKSFVGIAAPVGDSVHAPVQLTLSGGVEIIDRAQENWEVVERLSKVFHYTVSREGHSFTDACEEAFQLALMACRAKQWDLLSLDDVKDDLARLAVYVRDSVANYAIAQRESWIFDLIERRIDIHSVDIEGNTLLHTAARTGAAHLVVPLRAHLDPHATNLAGQTPLELAILFGQSKVVLELIKQGVNPELPILVGESEKFRLDGIGFAVMRGEKECIDHLVNSGRCLLTRNYPMIGNLFHIAIYFNQYAAFTHLLEIYKDQTYALIEQQNDAGLSPLNLAASLEGVQARKFALQIKRAREPATYPAYYDHLLEKGYIHLYDHLLEMKGLGNRLEREARIQTLSFCEISHIILEARTALIDAVAISADKPSLFLLGSTGSGKSTTFCFLRGDEMRVNGDGSYSSMHAGEDLIGHGISSCTFLPMVAEQDGMTIVDYPGFDDSNGPLVALGMECALKALIHKYQPRILVLDAITNVEGKYVAQTRMGNLLRRLLGSTEYCVVGLTKYSKQPDWIKLRTIETRQREELSAPSAEEIKLEAKIQAWKELDDPALQPKIEAEEKKLAQVIRSREGVPLTDLPDTPEKKECRKRLEEQEQELLRQLGLTEKLRLVDLEDPRGKSQILRAISEFRRATNPVVQQDLDADYERLLKERFEQTVIPLIEARSFEEVAVSKLERITLESSLINALLFSSHPEIVECLHLPEIDPNIAQFFSRLVVKQCIDKLVKQAIEKIDLTLIDKLLDEFAKEVSPSKLTRLKEKQTRFANYILGLIGERADTLKQSEEKWSKLREEKLAVEKKVEGKYELSFLSRVGYSLLLGIPLWLHNKKKYTERTTEVRRTLDEHCDAYSKALDEAYASLETLKGLEKVVEKKAEIDRALQTFSLSFDSLESLEQSIETTIGQVKMHYGFEEWEKRVLFLRKRMSEVCISRGFPLALPYEGIGTIEEQEIILTARAARAAARAIETAVVAKEVQIVIEEVTAKAGTIKASASEEEVTLIKVVEIAETAAIKKAIFASKARAVAAAQVALAAASKARTEALRTSSLSTALRAALIAALAPAVEACEAETEAVAVAREAEMAAEAAILEEEAKEIEALPLGKRFGATLLRRLGASTQGLGSILMARAANISKDLARSAEKEAEELAERAVRVAGTKEEAKAVRAAEVAKVEAEAAAEKAKEATISAREAAAEAEVAARAAAGLERRGRRDEAVARALAVGIARERVGALTAAARAVATIGRAVAGSGAAKAAETLVEAAAVLAEATAIEGTKAFTVTGAAKAALETAIAELRTIGPAVLTEAGAAVIEKISVKTQLSARTAAEKAEEAVAVIAKKTKAVVDDFALTLFLGQDSCVEVIKISGNFSDIGALCVMSKVLEGNALLFRSTGMVVILKQYREQEQRFLQKIDRYVGKLEGINRIEILSGAIKTVGQRSEGVLSFSVEKRLTEELVQFEREVGITVTTPFAQMLIRDALKPHFILGGHCFWMRGLCEVPFR